MVSSSLPSASTTNAVPPSLVHLPVSPAARKITFTRLAPYPQPLRGMRLLFQQRDFNLRRVQNLIREYELADVPLHRSEDFNDECSAYHDLWTQKVLAFYGLPPLPGALSEMSYVFFRQLSEHTDGDRAVSVEGLFKDADAIFFNIQVTGSGTLSVGSKKHRIQAGDAYLLNPLARHAWSTEYRGMCRAVSYLIPKVLANALVAGS